jgi:hypothetical protein
MSVALGHHLLPHERWAATFTLRRQSTHRTQAILRLEQNYGPGGMALFAAALITVIPAELMIVTGIVFWFPGGGDGATTLGNILVGVGLVLGLLGGIRLAQAGKAGRAFRGDRPFVRR